MQRRAVPHHEFNTHLKSGAHKVNLDDRCFRHAEFGNTTESDTVETAKMASYTASLNLPTHRYRTFQAKKSRIDMFRSSVTILSPPGRR